GGCRMLETDLQRLEQRLRLGIYADAPRFVRQAPENPDLLPQLAAVDRLRSRLVAFGAIRFDEDLVEDVFFDLLGLDELLGELRVALNALITQRFEALAENVQRRGDRLRRR